MKVAQALHKKVAQTTCDQILAYQVLLFPVEVDQLLKYGLARVTAYCLCKDILINGS